ncbi:MAG: cold shock domain-containing protein [Candidatus Pacebacteria bacterium]|nr:cold shock domain-containing protein [Candidatus Paceibacterota bacterium]
MEGTIKTLTEKGFGFIAVEGEEKDLFFHGNELKGVKYEDLKVGDKVSFEKADSPKGANAVNVSLITSDAEEVEETEEV